MSGLAARVETALIPGTEIPMTGRVFDYTPGTLEPPAVWIVPGDASVPAITYDSTFARGSDDLVFTLALAVSRQAERDSYTQLGAFLAGDGASSIKAAVEGDSTLDGIVSFARVARVTRYGPLTFNDLSFIGATLIAEVTT